MFSCRGLSILSCSRLTDRAGWIAARTRTEEVSKVNMPYQFI